MSTETLEFDVDQNIIYDVIARQAGSRGKAVLEGVMNSLDAGASAVHIHCDDAGFRIIDDGHGMRERYEIDNFFRTFGKPHETDKATWGKFRIGRGQMMVWGQMVWCTGPFRIDVDFKHKGLEFSLTEVEQPMACGTDIQVSYYEPLDRYRVLETDREIRSLVRYMPVPIYLNGEQINTIPSEMNWDVETDRYWIKIKGGEFSGVEFYNQGAYVTTQHMGVGAVVVTKLGHPLDLNMARNQILEDQDELYSEIRQTLRDKARQRSRSNTQRMTDSLRRQILSEISTGEYTLAWPNERNTKPLSERSTFRNALGRGVAPARISSMGKGKWCFAPKARAEKADALIAKGVTVLDPVMLEWAGICDAAYAATVIESSQNRDEERDLAQRFVDAVLYRSGPDGAVSYDTGRTAMKRFESFGDLADSMTGDKEELTPAKDLTKKQQALFRALKRRMEGIAIAFRRAAREGIIDSAYERTTERELAPGRSDTAAAWTDGAKKVWINKNELKVSNYADAVRLIHLIVHEYVHLSSSAGSHEHDFEFYATFHELALESTLINSQAKSLMADYQKMLKQRGIHVSTKVETQDVLTHAIETAEA